MGVGARAGLRRARAAPPDRSGSFGAVCALNSAFDAEAARTANRQSVGRGDAGRDPAQRPLASEHRAARRQLGGARIVERRDPGIRARLDHRQRAGRAKLYGRSDVPSTQLDDHGRTAQVEPAKPGRDDRGQASATADRDRMGEWRKRRDDPAPPLAGRLLRDPRP